MRYDPYNPHICLFSRVEDFLGQPILKSKRKCPVCGGNHWYACDFGVFDDRLELNSWEHLNPIIDSTKPNCYAEADICIDCLTVFTGTRD
jgi:hypothetical protein